MKKEINNMIKLLLCVIIAGITIFSCSKDEDSDTSIVGTWSCTDHYYGGTDTYIFKKNGTYRWFYEGEADWFSDQNGTYTYNGAILTVTKSSGYTLMYMVIGISKSSLVIMDDDGSKYTYYRK